MALDEVGFEDTTEMVHLMTKLRINAEIKHVQTCTTEDCDNVNPNSSISNINTSNINIIGAHVETKIDDDINETKNDDDIKNDDIHSTASYFSACSYAYNTPKSLTANAHCLLTSYNTNRNLSKQ
eukprot:820180_1